MFHYTKGHFICQKSFKLINYKCSFNKVSKAKKFLFPASLIFWIPPFLIPFLSPSFPASCVPLNYFLPATLFTCIFFSWISPFLNPSFPEFLLSCIPPFLCLSCIPPFMLPSNIRHLSCLAFFLYCIPLMHPSLPGSLLTWIPWRIFHTLGSQSVKNLPSCYYFYS